MATRVREAPTVSGATHYKFTVKAPILAFGTQFNPGTVYTVKAKVYEEVKAVAENVQPITKQE